MRQSCNLSESVARCEVDQRARFGSGLETGRSAVVHLTDGATLSRDADDLILARVHDS